MEHRHHHGLTPNHTPWLFPRQDGFSLMALIGVIAVMTIGLSLVSPAFVKDLNRRHQEIEHLQLRRIADGIYTYLQQNKTFPPTLSNLVPKYVPSSTTQVSTNAHGFPRYFVIHPDMTGFNNRTGLSASELVNARFLLFSHLSQDIAPTITTSTEFETWWMTNESLIPNLHLHRGNLAHLFYSLGITPEESGASYFISSPPSTDSGGGLLPTHNAFHLAGTLIGFDEAITYAIPEVQFALTTNTSYWFDPNCTSGKQWNPLNPNCGCTLTNLPIVNPGFETGDLTGWTKTGDLLGNGGTNQWGAVTSSFHMSNAQSGSYFAAAEAGGSTGSLTHSTGLSQRIDISSCASQIDVGDLLVNLSGLGFGQNEFGFFDGAKLRILFFDAVTGGAQVGSEVDSNETHDHTQWLPLSIPDTIIPATTRSIEIQAIGTKNNQGTIINVGVDDITGSLISSVP